jgi:hypothetical protein
LLQGQVKFGKWLLGRSGVWKLEVGTNARDKIGQTHLQAPASEGDSDAVELLLIKVVSKVPEPQTIDRYGRKMAKTMWLRQ